MALRECTGSGSLGAVPLAIITLTLTGFSLYRRHFLHKLRLKNNIHHRHTCDASHYTDKFLLYPTAPPCTLKLLIYDRSLQGRGTMENTVLTVKRDLVRDALAYHFKNRSKDKSSNYGNESREPRSQRNCLSRFRCRYSNTSPISNPHLTTSTIYTPPTTT